MLLETRNDSKRPYGSGHPVWRAKRWQANEGWQDMGLRLGGSGRTICVRCSDKHAFNYTFFVVR